ncbi:MAG: hypothetical protein U0Z17_03260 [Bacteroidales bacterium]
MKITIEIVTSKAKISPEAMIRLCIHPRLLNDFSFPDRPSITISRLPKVITQKPQNTIA